MFLHDDGKKFHLLYLNRKVIVRIRGVDIECVKIETINFNSLKLNLSTISVKT